MPVMMVRNTLDGPLVLSSDPKGTHFVEWSGAGDEMGGDVQPVPEEFAGIPAFHKQILRGTLVVENPEDNPELQAILERQQQAWANRQDGAKAAATAALDPEVNNDIVTEQCVGPNPRGQGQCENFVPVKDKEKGKKPPLCSVHTELSNQFVPTHDVESGKTVIKWTRSTMGKRQKQDD